MQLITGKNKKSEVLSKMIKNLVFDLGNVLVEFRPEEYMKRLGIRDINVLTKTIFKDKRWNEFDRGTLTIQEYVSALKSENPDYAESIDRIFCDDWANKLFRPKQATGNFLQELSKQYDVFVLSNVSEYVLNYIRTLDFFRFVTGGTYSYMLKACKPEKRIYTSFLQDHSLNAEECLFLDDLPQNIIIARELGMHGIVFKDNFEEIRDFLKMHASNQVYQSEP